MGKLIHKYSLIYLSISIFCYSCSVSKQISKSAKETVLTNKALTNAHVGISIFDPSENKYLYNFQGDKYFVPASNTKIPTCYAAMKYLGDSLISGWILHYDTAILIHPNADPTLLHQDFPNQPFITRLKNETKPVYISDGYWREEALGSGWAWNDYDQYYMAERSALPVYGNVIKWVQETSVNNNEPFVYSIPEINWPVSYSDTLATRFEVKRELDVNSFTLLQGKETRNISIDVPFVTAGINSAIELLRDTIKRNIFLTKLRFIPTGRIKKPMPIYSQATDSMLKPMMHRSDNFFAEQSLLMVSFKLLAFMNDSRIIDTILKTDFKDLPQKPRWADGSGLSRYNLFSPQDFVTILNKMKNEFGMDRIKVIFPTGGEGTISSYYKADIGYIYGKTGTLSGVVAFSGFMYTKKGKLLIFSTLVNNHQASATDVRRSIEKFLQGVRNKY